MEKWLEQITEEEVEKYCLAAMKGDSEAQYRLGRCYYHGKGIGESMEDAVMWFRRAADQEDGEAMYWLAECYLSGYGFEDEDEASEAAIELLEEAANQYFIAEAMFRLGECYENGEGVDADMDQAVDYYLEAANEDHEEAQARLGTYYLRDADEKDPQEAFKWFWLAAKQGNVIGQYHLGEWFEDIDKEEAEKWFRMAAEQGDNDAQYNLGKLLKETNQEEAEKWFRMAAEQGHFLAKSELNPLSQKSEPTMFGAFSHLFGNR